jgi:anti-sigma28 factor (negative regulator of flagellin synthesis)
MHHMALSESEQSGSNVMNLDNARRKRRKSDSPTRPVGNGNRRFDKVKVARIKAALANGEYRINYLNVADKFIEHERFG